MPGLPTHAITTGTPDIAPSKFQNRSQRKLPFSRTLSSTFQEKRGLEDANRTTAYPAEGKRQDNSLASSIHHMRHYVNSVPSGAQSHVHTNGKAALQLRECFALRGDVARGDVGVTLPSASPRTIQVSARANVADIAGGVLVFPGCCCYLIVWAHTSAQVSLPSGDTGAPRLDVSSSKPLQHHYSLNTSSPVRLDERKFLRKEYFAVIDRPTNEIENRYKPTRNEAFLSLESVLFNAAKGQRTADEELDQHIGIYNEDFDLLKLSAQLVMLTSILRKSVCSVHEIVDTLKDLPRQDIIIFVQVESLKCLLLCVPASAATGERSYVPARSRSRSDEAIRTTLTRTPSASSLLCAGTIYAKRVRGMGTSLEEIDSTPWESGQLWLPNPPPPPKPLPGESAAPRENQHSTGNVRHVCTSGNLDRPRRSGRQRYPHIACQIASSYDVERFGRIEVLRVDGGEAMREWGSAGMKGRVRRDIPEKTLPTSGIVRHDSLLRKCGSAPAGD
ncbi:hypothetical protein PR048_008912 [Dryococelus australis]|uniref:Uncharacterized protein n=1 Tax=Dryococelus australis TaxID=614101 RepID=A0ABQ9HYF1_9NEOP|nr:hypothetical protein PR048_008912 [Dryococelus australis]